MIELDNKPSKNPFKQLSLEEIDKFIEDIRQQTQETKIFITKVNQEIDNHNQ